MLSSTISGSAAMVSAVFEIEPVAGMDFEPEIFARAAPALNALEFHRRHRGVPVDHGLAPGAGVDLDHRRADFRRGLDLLRIRGDEQRDADAGGLQFGDDRHEMIVLAHHVEAALGGHLLAPLRHDAGRVRPRLERDVDHLARRRHFEIQRLGELRLQPRDVVVADVAAVLAQMRRDAVGAGLDGQQRRLHGIGMPAAARVADGRDVIDVDAEAELVADIL